MKGEEAGCPLEAVGKAHSPASGVSGVMLHITKPCLSAHVAGVCVDGLCHGASHVVNKVGHRVALTIVIKCDLELLPSYAKVWSCARGFTYLHYLYTMFYK